MFSTQAGTPRGGIISPVLANLALDGLQRALASLSPTVRAARAAQVNLVRYADDFIIIGSSRELLEDVARPWVEKFLAARRLVLSKTKSTITHVTGVDFLGWNVRYFDSGLLVQPSKKYQKAFLDKIRDLLRSRKAVAQTQVSEELTSIIGMCELSSKSKRNEGSIPCTRSSQLTAFSPRTGGRLQPPGKAS